MDTARKSIFLSLQEIAGEEVGGKARGLARLLSMGLDVPNGFVVVNAEQGFEPVDLFVSYSAIGGGAVAVRSSALGEDAAGNSFAGQFETILNVKGEEALLAAVQACVASLQSERALAYQQQRQHAGEAFW